MLAQATRDAKKRCADYGMHLGTAFQLVDDVLDYAGDRGELGKNVGDDLREGKPTLPLIMAMRRGTPDERGADPPRHRARRRSSDFAPWPASIAAPGALDATRERARARSAQSAAVPRKAARFPVPRMLC